MEPISGTKVGLVITKSNWGGAQSYVYTLGLGLTEAGSSVVVFGGGTGSADAASGTLFERLSANGIKTVYIPGFMRDISLLREFQAFWQLFRAIRRERLDVLHLNSSKAGGIGALAGRLAGVRRIVFTAHGWAHREPRPALARLLIWIVSFITTFLVDRIIVVSERDLKDAPAPFMKRKLALVHNGLRHYDLEDRDTARAILGVAPHEIALIMSAELHTNKGQDLAIEALARLKTRFENLVLVFAGDGEERDALRALAQRYLLSDRVRFLGFVPDVRRYLSGADIYLMPSRKEGFPFSLLEAGLAGLPVVATRTGGVPEVIKDGLTGALVPPENTAALAETVALFAKDALLRKRLGNALRRRVEEVFSEEMMIRGTVRAYLEK